MTSTHRRWSGNFTEEERKLCLARGQATLEQAFTHPALIGYTWYKFCWNPLASDQPSYGLIDSEGHKSSFNTEAMVRINSRLEGIAMGRLEPTALPA